MMSLPLYCQTPGQKTIPVDWWNRTLCVRKPHTPNATHNTGRWETRERLCFLQGMRIYGKGRWKQISELISTRTAVQVKTHGQVVLKRMDQGENVFDELDRFQRYILSKRENHGNGIGGSATKLETDSMTKPITNLDPEDIEAANTLFVMRKMV